MPLKRSQVKNTKYKYTVSNVNPDIYKTEHIRAPTSCRSETDLNLLVPND